MKEKNKNDISKLCKISQSETDDSVMWNPYNKVVQSHRDGTQYVSVDKALEFARKYNKNYGRKDYIWRYKKNVG